MALPNKVNIGTAAGNGTGDPARTAFDKLNKRDEYLDTNKADKSEITALQTDIDSKETPAGAQAKADAAEAAANSYTDSLLQGRKWKDAADVATTGNITLSGEQTIDGVLTSASRVLVKNQTNKAENGIYTTGTGAWTRTADADSGAELEAATLKILGGTENLNKIFTCNSTSITIGTTDVVFAFIGEGTDHNSTTGIQGGQAGEYYHLTQAERDKLTGIEAGATADQTASEIKTLYESNTNTNAFTDARRDKLDGIPASIEPAFTKNTAFNKDFGQTDGTVAEGNDSRINNGQTAYGWGDHSQAGYASNTSLSTKADKDLSNLTAAEAEAAKLNLGNRTIKEVTEPYTFVLEDKVKHVISNAATNVIPSGVFQAGDLLAFTSNRAGGCTITTEFNSYSLEVPFTKTVFLKFWTDTVVFDYGLPAEVPEEKILVTDEFFFSTGDTQTKTLRYTPVNGLIRVYVNGNRIYSTQYNLLNEKQVEILDTLTDGNPIAVDYERLASDLITLLLLTPQEGIEQWNVDRNCEASYIDSNGVIQTAQPNEARIDYSTGSARILVEPQSTNLIYNHSLFRATQEIDVITSPDGQLTGDKLVGNSGQSYSYIAISANVEAGKDYTLSVYLKEAGITTARLTFLSDNEAFAPASKTVALNGDWQRFSFTAQATATTTGKIGIYLHGAGEVNDGVNGMYFWGYQLEALSKMSSYIPTASSIVTRLADVITITPPAGTTQITEVIDGATNTVTNIPATYQIPNGNVSKIEMK